MSSLLDSLKSADEKALGKALDALTDEQAAALLYDWPFWARENQLAPPGSWRIWLVLAGRGFGKTRIGAEWTRAQVEEFDRVNLIGPTAADVRDVMIEGESGIMAVCPPWQRPEYLPSRKLLRWPNGARSDCFSAEDPESLRGPQHQRLWGDEVRAWPYMQQTFDMALLGLRLDPDPRACFTSTPRPVALLRDLVSDPEVVISKGSTYENRDNLAPAFFHQIIKRYEGTRLGRQELDAEILLDEGLAYRITSGVQTVPPFALPESFDRFGAMDFGTQNPCWLAFAVDYDGNVICFGLEDEPGMPSEQAALIKQRSAEWSRRNEQGEPQEIRWFAPPDIKGHIVRRDIAGNELRAEQEFNQYGLYFQTAQNDRVAGFLRVSEMLKPDEGRVFPAWHPLAGESGSPRAFIFDNEEMAPLIENLRDAPLEDPESPISKNPGEAVDGEWEHRSGHKHAAYRYGLMSLPSASEPPKAEPQSPEELREFRVADRLKRLEQRAKEDLIDV